MKKLLLLILLLALTNSAFSNCLPPAPPGSAGKYPIQVEYWGWSGTISPNLFTNTATVYNSDNSILGTYPIANISSNCSGTTGTVVFQVIGVGDGNTWVGLNTFFGYNKWDNRVLWYGVIYSRTHW